MSFSARLKHLNADENVVMIGLSGKWILLESESSGNVEMWYHSIQPVGNDIAGYVYDVTSFSSSMSAVCDCLRHL